MMPVSEHIDANRRGIPFWIQAILMAFLVLSGVMVSAGLGYIPISWSDVVRILTSHVMGQPELAGDIEQITRVVVMDVRMPRILTAALVGGGLAVAGAVFQAILLNPLADPYTLGVSAGAAFGAALAILLDVTFLGTWGIPGFAFAGAVTTLMIVMALSTGAGGVSSNNLILSGIIVAAILSAALSFLKYLADEQVGVIIFWLMGSFASRTWAHVGLTLGAVTVGFTVVMVYARDLNLLSLGGRSAAALGVDTRRVMLVLLTAGSLVTAVCVSVSGIIGFVGLLVPHMMRGLTGPDNRRLIPICLLAGAVLLLGADTLTRAILPGEIPIGVLTALIGGPFFCYIFRRRQMGRRSR